MPIDAIQTGDRACDFRDKVNELITAVNSLTTLSIPTGLAIDWYGDPEDDALWDANGIGLANSQMNNWAQCKAQDLAALSLTSTIKNPDGSGDVITVLPDPTGKFSVARKEGDIDFGNVGNIGGAKTVQLTLDELPEFDPTPDTPTVPETAEWGYAQVQATPGTEAIAGGGGTNGFISRTGVSLLAPKGFGANEAHENLPPYFTWVKIIKFK